MSRTVLFAIAAFVELLVYFTALLYVILATSPGWLWQVLGIAAVISVVLLPFTVGIACWKSPRWAVGFMSLGIVILVFSVALMFVCGYLWANVPVRNPQVMSQGLPAMNVMITLYCWSPLAAILLIIPSGPICLIHLTKRLTRLDSSSGHTP
jgi:hypothetical protein